MVFYVQNKKELCLFMYDMDRGVLSFVLHLFIWGMLKMYSTMFTLLGNVFLRENF